MSDISLINSNSYWNHRFAENWEAFEGPRQSRFFVQHALENLPSWLIEQIRRQSLTLVDWGCAQGDGTDVWASHIPATQLLGVDFSSIAIEKASKRYPSIKFLCENWLEPPAETTESYDVVFSSNTLEHFHNPYEVLETLSTRARKAVVLALPYREIDRIEEHFFSFFANNIPLELSNGFSLIWSKVLDCSCLKSSQWGGSQIFLVYADPSWVASLKLTLANCEIGEKDIFSEIQTLKESIADRDEQIAGLNQAIADRDEQITGLNQAIADRDEQIAGLNQAIADRDEQIAGLNQAIADRDKQIAGFSQSIADRNNQITNLNAEVLKISDWASHINSHPFRHWFRKTAGKNARIIYRNLPLPDRMKQKMKSAISPLRSRGWGNSVATTVKPPSPVPVKVEEVAEEETLYAFPPQTNPDICIFSIIDWHFRIQRPQHLAREFARKGHRVFFFSCHFVDEPTSGFSIEHIDPSLPLYQVKLSVKGAPPIYFSGPSESVSRQIREGVLKLLELTQARSGISLVQHAYWYPAVKYLPNFSIFYDCMDHHEGFGNVPDELVTIEKDLLRGADRVVVTSSWLYGFAQDYNENVSVVRNAGDFDHFVRVPQQTYVDPQGRKIIGYYGAIAEWFDGALVEEVAQAFPEALLLLVGNDTVGLGKKLKKYSNVCFTGEVKYEELPYYLHAFDVCLLPFKVIPLTLATNPVKVYEYLGAGKPVVSVDLPELAQFEGQVHIGKDKDEFLGQIREVLAQGESPRIVEKRQEFASMQTWSHRVEAIWDAYSEGMPKVSVIVLTYNNLGLTKSCLASLDDYSEYPNLEIVVVDNNSSDGTQKYLVEYAYGRSDVTLVLNQENLGFAAGNNKGLVASTGDYIVFLNNDTVVTSGWIGKMLRHFRCNPQLGILGPVTNNIGNEARIQTHYSSLREMHEEAKRLTNPRMGQLFALRTTAFFCAMVPRSVYERVGALDEAFGRGFFEDDDYCRRIEQLGLRVACAEDVFIHHHLSASFNKLKDQHRQKLFEQNQAIYEAKWGRWMPHRYRSNSSDSQ